MGEVRHFRTGGLDFSIELDSPWKFMEYTVPVAERIRRAAAGEVLEILPTRAGDDIPERTLVKDRSELPEEFDARTLDFSQYEPFAVRETAEELFRLKILGTKPDWAEELREADMIMDVTDIIPGYRIYRHGTDTVYEFLRENGSQNGFMLVPEDCHRYEFATAGKTGPYATMSMIDFATRIACTYNVSRHNALMVHSSVVSLEGEAYMFLGTSGTGKSTHSRLWLDNIPGTELVNDDNPIIRIEDGKLYVYGTPWSGKTPCYRNVKCPVHAIVKLNQAPENRISRLKGLNAYTGIAGSVSSIRWSRQIMDDITSMLSRIAMTTPCFSMDCRPNREAAEVCCQGVSAPWSVSH